MSYIAKRTRKTSDGRERTTYVARHRAPDGRLVSKVFDRQADARRWLTVEEGKVLKGDWVDPAHGRQTLRGFSERWLELQNWRDSTRHGVENSLNAHVLPKLGDRPLGSLQRSDVQAFINGLHLAPSTVKRVHQHLRTLLSAAVEDHLIARNPALGVRLPRIDKGPVVPLTAEQVWTLAEAAPPSFRAAVVVGAGLGLRQGEAMGLSVDRVDWLRRQVRVDRQMLTSLKGQPPRLGPPKTEASYRTVPAPDVVLSALTDHVAAFGAGPDGLVFHDEGQPVDRSRFGRLWRGTVARAGLPTGTRYHDLRHRFASALIAAGCSVRAVQEALGHSSAAMTLDVYSHLWPTDPDRIRDAVQATLAPPGDDAQRIAHPTRTTTSPARRSRRSAG